MSAFLVFNKTQGQVTLNLLGVNAVTLMPQGSMDSNGSSDRATLLDGEERTVDVLNALVAGKIGIEPVLAATTVRSTANIMAKKEPSNV